MHAQGISNYNRAPARVSVADMENAVAKYDAELAAMGLNLRELTGAAKGAQNSPGDTRWPSMTLSGRRSSPLGMSRARPRVGPRPPQRQQLRQLLPLGA